MNLFTQGHHSIPNQVHCVLPANQSSNSTDLGIANHQVAPVPSSPDGSFCMSRLEFSMLVHHPTFPVEIDQGVVKRAVLPLIHPHHDVGICLPGRFPDCLCCRTRYLNRILEKLGKERCPKGRRAQPYPVRISGNVDLWKNYQCSPLTSCFLYQMAS